MGENKSLGHLWKQIPNAKAMTPEEFMPCVQAVLKTHKPQYKCPAGIFYHVSRYRSTTKTCRLCRRMVGLPEGFNAAQLYIPDLYVGFKKVVPCPCYLLGEVKAIELASLAVELFFYKNPEGKS